VVRRAANIGSILDPAGAPDGPAFSLKSFLKIGFGVDRPIPVGNAFEDVDVKDGLLRGGEVVFVVGRETEFAARSESAGEIANEFWLDQPAWPVAALGPGIGKEDVGDRDAAGREEIANGVTELKAKDAEVGLLGSGGALFNFADAAEEAFNGEEIHLRMEGSVSESEATIARAEIEFDGVVIAEDGTPI
jgi:hypothetical protein